MLPAAPIAQPQPTTPTPETNQTIQQPVAQAVEFPSANSQTSQPNPLPVREAAVAVSPTSSEPSATPTPTSTPTPTPSPTPLPKPTIAVVSDLETLFTKFADQYHVDKEVLKGIARCESGFNATSNNSGMYLGMYQFAAQTWQSTRNAMGLDPNPELRTNPEEAIKTAAYKIANGGINAWPNCH